MRSLYALMPAVALTLAGCGAPELALPEDFVGKAATCAVVSAADARAKNPQNFAAPLAFESQAQIIQYALLAGAQEERFSSNSASAVVQKMQEIQDDVTGGDWKSLVQPCKSAFPETDLARPVTLPDRAADAQMGCYALGKFMMRALSAQGNAYERQLLEYGALGRDLDPKLARNFDQRGIRSDEARQTERNKALTRFAKLGSPAKVMEACTTRFS